MANSVLAAKSRIFSIALDPATEDQLDHLKGRLSKTSRADVIRTALKLLKTVQEAQDKGLKLNICDPDKGVQTEILLLS